MTGALTNTQAPKTAFCQDPNNKSRKCVTPPPQNGLQVSSWFPFKPTLWPQQQRTLEFICFAEPNTFLSPFSSWLPLNKPKTLLASTTHSRLTPWLEDLGLAHGGVAELIERPAGRGRAGFWTPFFCFLAPGGVRV